MRVHHLPLLALAALWTLPASALDLSSSGALPKVVYRVHRPASLAQFQEWNVPAEWMEWMGRQEALRADAQRTLALRSDQPTYNLAKPSVFDLTRVDTWVDIDRDQTDYLEVETLFEFTTVDNPLSNISFIMPLAELVSVESPDREVTGKVSGSMLKISIAPALELGETMQLRIRVKGAPADFGDSMLPTVRLKGDIWYVTHSRFMPIKNDNTDVFVGNMVLRVKGGDVLAAGAGGTGTLTDVSLDAGQAVKTFTFQHTDPTSLYAFSVSDFVTVSGDSPWNTSVVVQPYYVQFAGPLLGIMDDVLNSYSQWYFPYAWDKLDAVQMPNSFSGGFGPLSTIMCAQSVFAVEGDDGAYSAAQLFSHEIGHQWWGNLVEMGDEGSIFLSESMAEFSSDLYFEKTYNSRWTFYSNNMEYLYTVNHDVAPAIISPFVYNSAYYYQIAYQKGACIADMLRMELGEEVLLAAIQLFMERYHENFATVEQFFAVLEESTGRSLATFWEQWMKGQTPPWLYVMAAYKAQDSALAVEIRQEPGKEFTLTLPLRVEFQDGSLQELLVAVEGSKTQVSFPVTQAVRRVAFDPRRKQIRRLVPLAAGDVDCNGTLDGRDLVELSFAFGTDIVYGNGGGNYFIPNASYDEMADIAGPDGPGDVDGQINDLDFAYFLEKVGQ